MTIARAIVAMSALFLLAGCAGSAEKMNDLQLGMNQLAVVQVMGDPHSTSETDDVMYMRYYLSGSGLFADEYFVRLTDGTVDAYGRRGDFGLGY
jgi:hypothetical protein